MNQQRARRFRTAKEAAEALRLKEEGQKQGSLICFRSYSRTLIYRQPL